MAGIGFELKKLFTARTAAGHLKAYSYSALITAGPFALLTVMVLLVQTMFYTFKVPLEENYIFTGAIVYAFVFSQILSSGFVMVLTRYLADCLSVGRYYDIAASCLGMSAILAVLGSIMSAVFYWDKPLDFLTKLLAYLFFLQLLIIWVETVYLSAVQRYKRLLLSYGAGVSLAVVLSAVFLTQGQVSLSASQSALLALNIGMMVTVASFFLCIALQFGLPQQAMHFAFLPYFERHWRLFGVSLGYTLGLFLPNIIIWFGPWGVRIAGTYLYAPNYDVLTFYAFLTILPLMIMFVVKAETRFYTQYAKYFRMITQKGNFREIDDARRNLLHTLWFELLHIFEFQFVFTMIALSMSNYLLTWGNITNDMVNMFNVLLFAAFFTGAQQVVCVLLLYFDCQQEVLKINICYVVSSLVFGLLGLLVFGPKSYGFTFFLAALIAFLLALWRLQHFSRRINYFIFCSQPVFYNPPHGPLTRLVQKLYGDRYVNLELAGEEHETT